MPVPTAAPVEIPDFLCVLRPLKGAAESVNEGSGIACEVVVAVATLPADEVVDAAAVAGVVDDVEERISYSDCE